MAELQFPSLISSAMMGLGQPSDPDKKAYDIVDNLLKGRKAYSIPQEILDAYNGVSNQVNADQDTYLKNLNDVTGRKLSEDLSNVYRNSTSGADAQINAGKVLNQFSLGSLQNVVADQQQKNQLRGLQAQLAGQVADERNNSYIYNEQYPLEQRLEFVKAARQNAANLSIAQQAADATKSAGLFGGLGDILGSAIKILPDLLPAAVV